MTQVPASSHGAAAFNGGTITAPLIVDLTGQADATALKVKGAAAGFAPLIDAEVQGGGSSFQAQQSNGVVAGIFGSSDTVGIPGVQADGSGDVLPFAAAPLAPATVALVSGTGLRFSTVGDVETHTPVTFNPGVATIATCTVQISPNATDYVTLAVVTKPVGTVFDGEIEDIVVRVPVGWRLKLTVVNATLGTTTYY